MLNLHPDHLDLNLAVVAFILTNHSWDMAKLQIVLPPHFVSRIKGILILINDMVGISIWGPMTNG